MTILTSIVISVICSVAASIAITNGFAKRLIADLNKREAKHREKILRIVKDCHNDKQ